MPTFPGTIGAMTWIENTPALRAFEERSPELNATLERLARTAVGYARSIAPVGSAADEDEAPGIYRDSIDAVKVMDGPGWYVFAADKKAHWIEYGARHMPKYAVLTRAMEHISGLR